MRCLAALSPPLHSALESNLLHDVRVDGVDAMVGMLPLADVAFDPTSEQHRHAVLVRVSAFSLNYREKHRVLSVSEVPDKQYRVLGSEFVGLIEAVGIDVLNLKAGDRVIGNGCVDLGVSAPGLTSTRASAERQILAAHKVAKISDAMPDEVAAAFSVGAQTAYSMVNRLPLLPGENVLVTGATSNTSLFALKKLLGKGIKVHAITTNPASVKPLQAMRVTNLCLIDKELDFKEQMQKYLAESGVPYFDHVIDPFMDVYLPKLLPFVRRFGFYVSCGVARQSTLAQLDSYSTVGMPVQEVFSLLLRKSIALIGNNLGSAEDLNEALQDYECGKLRVNIAQVFDRDEQLAEFIHRSFCHAQRFGKVVFKYQ